MYIITQGRIPLKIGVVCVISNRRHPLYHYRGVIQQIDQGQIFKLVFIEHRGNRLVAKIHTNNLYRYHKSIATRVVTIGMLGTLVDNLSEKYFKYNISVEDCPFDAMMLPELDDIISESDSSIVRGSSDIVENGSGSDGSNYGCCMMCQSIGMIGAYCVSDECEDTGNIYA